MHFCRICCTKENLKYTAKQLQQTIRTKRKSEKLLDVGNRGNICIDCEDRLQKYEEWGQNEDSDAEVDVDCSGNILDLFLKNRIDNEKKQKLPLNRESEIEVIEILTSCESSPASSPKKSPQERIVAVIDLENEEEPSNELTSNILQNESSSTSYASNSNSAQAISDVSNNSSSMDTMEHEDECENPVVNAMHGAPRMAYKSTNYTSKDEQRNEEHLENTLNIKQITVVPENMDLSPINLPSITRSENTLLNAKEKIYNNDLQDYKNRCKRNYDEREFRLLASLSLLSSDSETDEQIPSNTKVNNRTPIKTNKSTSILTTVDSTSTIIKQSKESKQNGNELDSVVINCPECKFEFLSNQRLVYHMRRKHRSSEGNTLTERPRCSQDSAMTIRLRYLQRYTYYECQLCGRIDVIFKEHKTHIINEHAEESKSLKDFEKVNELKCPVCKEKCGTHYLSVCNHILNTHKHNEYKSHLKEITSMNQFGWKSKKQHTTRVFQFNKRKAYFFQCKLCEKVSCSQMKHLKHMNSHREEEIKRIAISKAKKVKPIQMVVKTLRKSASNSEAEEYQSLTQKSKRKLKNSDKKQKISKNVILQEESEDTSNHKLRKKDINAALVRVKVRPLLKQFPTQKYKCQFCGEEFQGFCLLNFHILSEHRNIEYHKCNKCVSSFTSTTALEQHSLKHQMPCTRSRKQKFTKQIQQELQTSSKTISFVDENFNTDCSIVKNKNPRKSNDTNTNTEDENTVPNWLQELLAINGTKYNIKTTQNTSYPCKYCLHLYGTLKGLKLHEEMHVKRNDIQLLKFTPAHKSSI